MAVDVIFIDGDRDFAKRITLILKAYSLGIQRNHANFAEVDRDVLIIDHDANEVVQEAHVAEDVELLFVDIKNDARYNVRMVSEPEMRARFAASELLDIREDFFDMMPDYAGAVARARAAGMADHPGIRYSYEGVDGFTGDFIELPDELLEQLNGSVSSTLRGARREMLEEMFAPPMPKGRPIRPYAKPADLDLKVVGLPKEPNKSKWEELREAPRGRKGGNKKDKLHWRRRAR